MIINRSAAIIVKGDGCVFGINSNNVDELTISK